IAPRPEGPDRAIRTLSPRSSQGGREMNGPIPNPLSAAGQKRGVLSFADLGREEPPTTIPFRPYSAAPSRTSDRATLATAGGASALVMLPSRDATRELLDRQFLLLAAQWKRETAHESSERRRITHPAYKAIIDRGWPVVPILLGHLQQDGA